MEVVVVVSRTNTSTIKCLAEIHLRLFKTRSLGTIICYKLKIKGQAESNAPTFCYKLGSNCVLIRLRQ